MNVASVDLFDFYGNKFLIQSQSEKLAQLIRKYWGKFHVKKISGKPSVLIQIQKRKTSRLINGCFYSNQNLLLLANSNEYVACNFGKKPWQIFVDSQPRNDHFLYFHLLEPLLLNTLKRLNLF